MQNEKLNELVFEKIVQRKRDEKTYRELASTLLMKGDSFLLLKRNTNKFNGWMYEIPWWWIEKWESPLWARKRELNEETGIEDDTTEQFIGHIDFDENPKGHVKQYNFLSNTHSEVIELSHTEHSEYIWMKSEDLLKYDNWWELKIIPKLYTFLKSHFWDDNQIGQTLALIKPSIFVGSDISDKLKLIRDALEENSINIDYMAFRRLLPDEVKSIYYEHHKNEAYMKKHVEYLTSWSVAILLLGWRNVREKRRKMIWHQSWDTKGSLRSYFTKVSSYSWWTYYMNWLHGSISHEDFLREKNLLLKSANK